MIRVGDSDDLHGGRKGRLTKICAVHGCGHAVAVAGDICWFHAAMADRFHLRQRDRAGAIAMVCLLILAAVVWIFARGR